MTIPKEIPRESFDAIVVAINNAMYSESPVCGWRLGNTTDLHDEDNDGKELVPGMEPSNYIIVEFDGGYDLLLRVTMLPESCYGKPIPGCFPIEPIALKGDKC